VAAVLTRRQVQEEAFRNSVSGMVESALEQQKETLGRQYETQLQREINSRWANAHAATDLVYPRAFLLLADLLGDPGGASEAALAERVRQAQQSARDKLYLFGATQVLPYGAKLLAVFSGDEASVTTPAEMRVLRAAVALAKGGPREQSVRVALHTGTVALVAVNDGLHGDQGHALVPGDSVNTVAALEEFAAGSGWRIVASEAMARTLADEARFGRRQATERGEPAIEITGIASTP
jgi:hypothetical protein